MIVDTSAVIAILRHEPGIELFARALDDAQGRAHISAATALECALVAGRDHSAELTQFLDRAVSIVPFDAEQLAVARAAHARFGRGSGSPARLNFGDCFSYALAKVRGEPLLFKGDDFGHTDIEPALTDPPA